MLCILMVTIVAASSTSLLTQTTAPTATADGFLFVTFKGQQGSLDEQIYFSLSKDGRNWTALNNSEPVLVSELGEKGVRDPYLLRSHDKKKSPNLFQPEGNSSLPSLTATHESDS